MKGEAESQQTQCKYCGEVFSPEHATQVECNNCKEKFKHLDKEGL